jgi:hypothetical protein
MPFGAGVGIPSYAGGGAGGSSGSGKDMYTRVNATNTATAASASSVTTGAVAARLYITIGTGYSGGGTIAVGQAGSPSLLLAAGVIDATVAGAFYDIVMDTALANLPILVTIGGAPAAGTCKVLVQWAVPQP